ncbi:MAG: 6-carboxytetrahydropterin synthase [Oligoflexia bacterium]|nr:6-carboxytetrahydropterin synthase [Oligoflexia bacterium]
MEFSSQHRLCSSLLTPQENIDQFGKCLRTHGHDYRAEVTIVGPSVLGRSRVEQLLKSEIHHKFHDRNLNDFWENTTGEILVQKIFDILSEKLHPDRLVRVRLQETPRNHFVAGLTEPNTHF